MKNKIALTIFLLLPAISFMACAPRQHASEVAATPSPLVQGDPTEGQASLMADLQHSGVEVELGDPVEQDFFTVKGRILKVNEADVQVFE